MKSRSLFNIINGVVNKPAKVKNKRIVFKPIPLGYVFALKAYYEGEHLDTLFIDHIDICRSYTMIHYNNRLMEIYPQKLSHTIHTQGSIWAFYENKTEIEIIRIS